MKRLYIHPQNDYTGSSIVLERIINESSNDSQSAILTRGKNGPLTRCNNIKHYYLPNLEYKGRFKLIKALNYLFTVLNWISEFFITLFLGIKFDEFYINTIVPFNSAIAGTILQKKIIYHVHEKFLSNSPLNYRIAEKVFCVLKSHKIYVSKYLESQFSNSTNGTSEVKYNKLSKKFLSKINIEERKHKIHDTVLMICSLNYSKGIAEYIEVANKMVDTYFILVISSDEKSIRDYIKELIPDNLKIFSKQENLHKFYRDSDIIVNLSLPDLWIETFGMTLLEGMSYGLPAIAPNIGGPTELIENGKNGFLIDPHNVGQVVAKITQTLSEDNYEAMSNYALLKTRMINDL